MVQAYVWHQNPSLGRAQRESRFIVTGPAFLTSFLPADTRSAAGGRDHLWRSQRLRRGLVFRSRHETAALSYPGAKTDRAVVLARAHIYTYTYIHTRMHSCMHSCMHTHTHTHMQSCIQTYALGRNVCMHTYIQGGTLGYPLS